MISGNQQKRLKRQMHRDESKIINIVLQDENQVAGVVVEVNSRGIRMSDGREYAYSDIREINGLYE